MEGIELEQDTPELRLHPAFCIWALSACFSFTLFFFAPLELYLGNRQEFWFTLETLLPVFIGLFVLSTGIGAGVLLCLRGRIRQICLALLMGITVGIYVQGNYMAGGYPLLTGAEIDWSSMHLKGILTTLVWVALLIASLALCIKKPKLFQKAACALPVFILAVEAVTLIVILLGGSGKAHSENTVCYYSSDEIFEFSKDENIIVLIVDSLEGPRFEDVLREGAFDADSLFPGFTYYSDTTGVGQNTLVSMTPLLTGQLYPVQVDQLTALSNCFADTTIYDDLKQHGYRTNLYEFATFAAKSGIGKIDNLKELSSAPRGKVLVTMTKQLYKLVFFRYAPHYLKRYFVKFGLVFDQEEAAFSDQYYVNDLSTWRLLRKKGVSAEQAGKLYSLYHFYGLHGPFRLTRHVEYGDYEENVPENERLMEQGVAVVTMVGEFLDGLRQAGIYDSSTIIITADHGSRSAYRFLPLFMVKFPQERQGFAESKTPVSLYEQFLPLLMECASGKAASQSWFSDGWAADRTRLVFRYDFDAVWEGAARSQNAIEVNGPAAELTSYSVDLFAP